MDKLLDHKALLEIMLRISEKGELVETMKGTEVVEEFVRCLRPFYQNRYPERGCP